MERGRQVTSQQTGFQIELPAAARGKIKVASTFGNTEAEEGAIATIVEGDFANGDLSNLFVTEPGE